ncbi:MAG: hypothetical protein P4L99_26450 [Chthoniobacter sp.]|nr:hypothetical protein [Chthoniobacter sp.]
MSSSTLRLGQVLMLLVLFGAAGGHWMVLQSVAWSRMLVSYAQDENFTVAVTKTFDGQHPCDLCKEIGRAKSNEPQSARALKAENDAAFVAPTLAVMVRAEGISWRLEIPEWHGEARPVQPVAPPPRSAQA